MLYIDGITLKYLKEEFEEELIGRKVTKVFQFDKLSLSIFFGKINFYFSINPQLPIVYMKDKKEDAPDKPMAFSLSLRKTLIGSILTGVNQYSSDRILQFTFNNIDELGVKREYHLIVELMGKHSNIILIDNERKIIDLIKKFSLEENKLRLLMPNVPYELPEVTEKYNAYSLSIEEYEKAKSNLSENVDGIGAYNRKRMGDYKEYQNIINLPKKPVAYMQEDRIKLASFTKFSDFENYEKREFDSCNELTEWYIDYTASSNKVNTLKKNMAKALKTRIKREKGTIKKLEKDVNSEEKFNRYKEYGDILAANIYIIKGRPKVVEVFDFYSNENILLELDEKLSPQENLEVYYKKYNKGKKSVEYGTNRIVELRERVEYLESLESYLKNAKSIEVLENLQDEFVEEGLIKKIKEKRSRKKREIKVGIEEVGEGIIIYYGRNNKENEHITFKMADKDDIWLHVKDLPGSHCIIKGVSIDEVEDEILFKAGELCRAYSKVDEDNAVQVDYCLRKFVKKPKGTNKGYVIYSNEKVLLIDPD